MIAVVPTPDGAARPRGAVPRALPRRCPGFAVPRYLRFLDELPKTPTQRIQKFKLRERRRHARHDRPRGARHLPAEGMRIGDSERDTACIPHLPALRGDVRPRGDDRAGAASNGSGETPPTSSARATSAPRARASATCTTTRTGSGNRTCAGRTARTRRSAGTRHSPRSSACSSRSSRPTAPTRSARTSATRWGTASPAASTSAASTRCSARDRSTRSARSTSSRSPSRAGCSTARSSPSGSPTSTARRISSSSEPIPSSRTAASSLLPTCAAGCGRSARAAGRWSSSTLCGRGPRERRTSTTSSGPGRTRCCSPRWRTPCSTRSSSACGALEEHVAGLAEVAPSPRRFPPERVARACGIEATQIRRLARELAAAESAAVYGRIGTTLQAFGTAASWLVDVLNVLTGNLDRPGGVMFTTPAAGGPTFIGEPGRGSGVSTARWHSRVRGLPEVLGELPLACLAEEIDTPGEGRLRALVTFSGNPALSNPNGQRLEAALGQLECLVCVDFYLNETTRQAHVILPPPSPLERAHYDLAVYPTAVRNVANYSPPALPLPADARDEWEIVLALTAIVGRLGAVRRPRGARPAGRTRRAPSTVRRSSLLDRGQRCGRAARLTRAAFRGAAAPRHLPPLRPLRGCLRRPARRAHPRGPRGGPSRDRLRPARAAAAGSTPHAERNDRARPSPLPG